MWHKIYGKTGKKISVVGFGGMRFDNPENIDANAEVVLHAHEKGINYFDTAPGYNAGKSEEIFGAAFKQMPRESFYCSTKSGKSDGKALRDDLEKSLRRMNVEKIDFFHIWYIIKAEQWPERKAGGAVAAVLRAKEEGLVGHLAASLHITGEEICKIAREGVLEGITVGYNILNFPFRAEALECAAEMNMGVVTMNPLGGGHIPNNAERLDFLRGPGDRSVVEAAIRFNVSHPAITSALVGFTTKQQVDEAVAAVENFQPYDAEHIENLKSRLGEGFDNLCTQCGYCLPCPEGVEIPKFLESYNYRIFGQSDEDIVSRLRYHWGLEPSAAGACVECGQCEGKCTQHLPVIERLKQIADLEK
ncbi:MAG: aldo/keto reductase [Planctomycetota bacterium]|nr:aldo/keto reductase [Planctomycetota bacterium]